ncbi:DoxX family protein [Corynebacterium sp. SCR221107]|uniref:DoxX family membrane protein n=1 Tax=Corynebacterium sp. SCR221107 TaxID=3017361 RepID=UPI0022EC7918|nr:DoxX family protein [Corynebacterium sp. SCR221107]WBT09917.1 DoxX family protein [Corynebacterium sp. SCR221107]
MIRKVARPMLASVYIADGADTVINSQAHVEGTQAVLKKVRTILPRKYAKNLPKDAEQVTRAVGAAKIGAGSMLALGKAPRTSASALALLAVPTMLARHAFWETQDKEEKVARKQGFLTSVALLGGLAITSVDTNGKPSVSWRAKKAAKKANKQLQQALPTANEQEKLVGAAAASASSFASDAKDWFEDAGEKVAAYADRVAEYYEDNKDDVADQARSARSTLAKVADSATSALVDTGLEWLEAAKDNSKTGRKKAVKTAVKTQAKAASALAAAEVATGRKAHKAAKKASKLEARAEKALKKAKKKVDKKLAQYL